MADIYGCDGTKTERGRNKELLRAMAKDTTGRRRDLVSPYVLSLNDRNDAVLGSKNSPHFSQLPNVVIATPWDPNVILGVRMM
jgi:hypothetical protein